MKFILSILAGLGAVAAATAAAPDSALAARTEFFENRIRPVLVNECYDCHAAGKSKGGLRVDFHDGLRKGGDSGPALVPGDPAGSLLIQTITHRHPDSKMPKDRPKLADQTITDFIAWIKDGAVDPRATPAAEADAGGRSWDVIFAARRDWWSFKPPADPSPPRVADPAWSNHPVDSFILSKLDSKRLRPAAPAGRRELLRRISYALTGLPPTTAELNDFISDTTAVAYARVVDRLLASPRFGERWARHWMDLVRFAETHGSEGDPEIPEAWRYRDYLIRAFNADVPIDRLIREHIAGDLLPDPRWNDAEQINESMLGLAQFRLVEHGFQPVDTLDEQVKTIDNQIDVLSKAFQGLTISCARCHDHKFDPISQRDYYALYGVLASVRPAQITIDAPARLRVHRAELEPIKQRIKVSLARAWRESSRELTRHLSASVGTHVPGLPIPGDTEAGQLAALEQEIASIDAAGRTAVLLSRGVSDAPSGTVQPMAAWTFDTDGRDAMGGLHTAPENGAVVRNGRLVVNGQGAFARSTPLGRPLREKTLEAWVALPTLDQGGGGVLTVETANGGVFDSIVFGERQPRKWMNGSDGFVRTQQVNGPPESARPDELIHFAISYHSDNSIALYRNGAPFGAPFTPPGASAKLRTFEAGTSRILLGMRHTGGANPFLTGEIEEARLYDRALNREEIATSFKTGPGLVSTDQIHAALTAQQQARRQELSGTLDRMRAAFVKSFPQHARQRESRRHLESAIEAAGRDARHPLHPWLQLHNKTGDAFITAWRDFAATLRRTASAASSTNAVYRVAWDLTGPDVASWFLKGVNPPESVSKPGEFTIEPASQRVLAGLLPAGVYSHRLSQKHNGVLQSPAFKVSSDSISVRVMGGKGARVRLVPDNYPIGAAGIFPQATLNSDAPTWVRLDTAYRKGTRAYLEFVPAAEVTARDRGTPGADGRSYFGVERVVFHDSRQAPRDEFPAAAILAEAPAIDSPAALAREIGRALESTIEAWANDTLREDQRRFLDAFVRSGLLPVNLDDLPEASDWIAEYRRLEADIPIARRAPGVIEAEAADAPLLSRGDHHRPLDAVPRGYLELVSSRAYPGRASGRLELARELTSPSNPLTARVMVNRVWHQLFGRGLVGTVDNFGRLGDAPTHPELLDYLATRLVRDGWSLKKTIRFLVTSRTYLMSSEASRAALESDPGNDLLSHMRVRRLDAESIRDSLLAIGGQLDLTSRGPGANALAPPAEQRRRSVYLTIRRNSLNPFLEVFDAPRPFTTLGRRDATNVPAQSLALLNDPFVVEIATRWAERIRREESEADARIRRMFEEALARPPATDELARSRAYLDELEREHGPGKEPLAWRDFAQSIFNLKEFIYLR